MTARWHILTGEYPPAAGGVSDYVFNIAGRLAAAGDDVHVWCPGVNGDVAPQAGVVVHSAPDCFGIGNLRNLGSKIDASGSGQRLLVQWVPHAFGMRSVNLPFCLWILGRSIFSRDYVELMIHEPYLSFSGSAKQSVAAIAHRLMLALLLMAASQVWVSVPRWWALSRPYALGRRVPVGWLPIPSNIPTEPDAARVAVLRRETDAASATIGHFGTYGPGTENLLMPILDAILDSCPEFSIRLIGRGSTSAAADLVHRHPEDSHRVLAADGVCHLEVASQICACDLMVQPYLDGASSRRTSLMACLALGRPVVAHSGAATEPLWIETDACVVADGSPDGYVKAITELVADTQSRRHFGNQGRLVYQMHFDIGLVVDRLRKSDSVQLSPKELIVPESATVNGE